MIVEIWSDFACPFCYIGKRRFEQAVALLEDTDAVEVIHRSFELDPNAPIDIDLDVYDMLSNKYGMSREEAKKTNDSLAQQAKAEGLDFHFDTMKLTNTFNAHRLVQLAKQQNKMNEMVERLFKAYFTESLHIGKQETLLALATEVGVNRQDVESMIKSDQFENIVRGDEQEAGQFGIRGVPYFVINRKYAVSGAQSVEVFLNALKKAVAE
ncbi:DsbA family oxidoreductase [Alkalihalobacillus sp. LMS39]|uniref:DsbA family oxidoreductase n=1 Tax=Alkalihalobacillus sp. LMS39 TaxID=2924032 RepID=UPI001FB56A9D|nr:DsbA family oxidoreductase [Alkalihalobacillus sp. LMS39]UOE92042.1 DsbA family oxidoreductase [Alkalihalobacillus sp. LMS39]